MRAPISRISAYTRWIIMFLLVAFAVPALAQNTKGERPVNNQRQIRETKGKTVKRKDKSNTRDLAGRRLRTKNKSSANSANVGIRQPNPYSKRPRVTTDRASSGQKRTYSESPSERPRAPKGDLSGHPIRTAKPRKTEAARVNIYPQSGPFMNNPDRRPKGDRPPKVNQSASGQPVIRRMPQQKERAWKGDLKGRPVAPPRSVTSQRQNTFPQPIPYSKYDKSRSPGDRAVSNQRELKRTSKLTHTPRTKSLGGGGYPDVARKGFVQRGRKNVYWGKFSKGEKPFTRDIAGAPLRKKNFRSPSPGLVGRDTLQHFNRRPGGDATFGNRRKEPLSAGAAKGGWRGDISGNQLRRITPSNKQVAGNKVFPRKLSATRSGERVGDPIYAPRSSAPKGEGAGKKIPVKGIPANGKKVGSYTGKGLGTLSKRFYDQGEGFGGSMRVRGIPSDAERVSSYRGNLIGGAGKTFENQGEGFSGYIKGKKQLKGGGSVSGQLWNNRNTAITRNRLPASASKPGGFAGHLLKAEGKTFEYQGEGFSGFIKARKPAKGGGSVSGQLWNNRNSAITQNRLPAAASKPGRFAGDLLNAEGKTFEYQGEGFSGYIKAKKPAKGGGTVSGQLWNNRNTAITQNRLPASASKPGGFAGHLLKAEGKTFEYQGEGFSGYIKAKKPAKGGGSISGQLWNNQGESTTVMHANKASVAAAGFQGKSKASSRKMNTDGFDNKGNVTMRQDFTQSPKAVAESSKKHEPNKDGFRIEGMRVRVERPKYSEREHTADGALRGVGPKRGSVRASEFSTGAIMADRRHNPFAADEAMKGTYYGGGAEARMGTFHGNLKVKKFSNNRDLHPDAKFAKDNNVKEERTVLTNVKLFWTKLFHNSSSQPNAVKDKGQRPRYSKGEFGIWEEKDANKNWAEQVKKPKTP